MKRKSIFLLCTLIGIFLLFGCGQEPKKEKDTSSETSDTEKVVNYDEISLKSWRCWDTTETSKLSIVWD